MTFEFSNIFKLDINKRFYLATFFLNLSFVLPIFTLFNTQYLNLNTAQNYFLATYFWLISIFLEIPTGSLADHLGRKKSYLIGVLAMAFGYGSLVFTKDFVFLIFTQTIAGFGAALQSGTLEALVYDKLKEDGQEAAYPAITANNNIALFSARLIACLVGGFTYEIYPTLPYLLLTISLIFAALIGVRFPSASFKSLSYKIYFSQIKRAIGAFLDICKINEVRLFLLGVVVFSGFGDLIFFGFQPWLTNLGLKPNQIGLVFVLISFGSTLGSIGVKYLLKKFNPFQLLKSLLLALSVIALLLAVLPSWLNLLAILFLAITFGAAVPVYNSYFQPKFKSEIRTTSLSLLSMIQGLASILFSYLTGIFVAFNRFDLMFILTFFFCILFLLIILRPKQT